jgi:two-component system, cell cycle response regulator
VNKPVSARKRHNGQDSLLSPLTGEFRDSLMEKDYRRQAFYTSRSGARLLALIFSLLMTAVMAVEVLSLPSATGHWLSPTLRLLQVAASILTLLRLYSVTEFEPMAMTLTVYEGLSVSVWFYLAYLLRESYSPLTIQTGALALVLMIFLIPNRWIHAVSLGATTLLCATALTTQARGWATPLNLWVSTLFMLGVLASAAVLGRRTECERRNQYLRHVKLLQVSHTDPLTGIANRGRFNEALSDWVQCANQYDVPLALVLFDFDDFKAVNDTYGHLIGDQVILRTVNLVDDAIRRRDIFARWGGEEFTLLFPDTRMEEAVEIVERLRQTIDQNRYLRCGHVTASFGVVQYHAGESPEAFMDRADRMLYRAKADGKNCIRAAG